MIIVVNILVHCECTLMIVYFCMIVYACIDMHFFYLDFFFFFNNSSDINIVHCITYCDIAHYLNVIYTVLNIIT